MKIVVLDGYIEICHHVAHHSNAVYEGCWENNADWCFWDYPLIELSGKTAGLQKTV
ncbi:glycerate dehydrogenase HprA [Lacrimispora sphenoides]|nr:hypothetical protein [Lacrimispora sphenoides]SUY50289.1 glycerate dehydrogenase HprA [Lacrimispora sphenoides]